MPLALYNSILYNASLYNAGLIAPDPAEPTVQWTDILGCLYPRLHAADGPGLVWWTEADLLRWADDALRDLGRGALLFVRRDSGTVTAQGQRTYALPDKHIATLHAAYDARALNPTDYDLIDALDAAADAAACAVGEFPKRWYEDNNGVHASIGIYPSPYAAETLELLSVRLPEAFASASGAAPVPRAMAAFIADGVLGVAWDHDSDFAMPELAEHFREKRKMYLDVYRQYWGPGQ